MRESEAAMARTESAVPTSNHQYGDTQAHAEPLHEVMRGGIMIQRQMNRQSAQRCENEEGAKY